MRHTAALPVGLFDSGMGGLTVLKALNARLPHEDLVYLGDTARLPYGTKGRDTIIRYTLKAARTLVDMGVKMLVVACNTATATALPTLREALAPLPVLGVVEPGAEAAVQASHNGHIVVIATEATIAGGAYQRAIARLRPQAVVTGRACTLFVPLAEEGWMEGPVVEGVARRYLSDLFPAPTAAPAALPAATSADLAPDTLLLGCTHFPLLLGAAGAHCGFRGHHSGLGGRCPGAPRPAAARRNLRRGRPLPLPDYGQHGPLCPHGQPLSGAASGPGGSGLGRLVAINLLTYLNNRII